MRFRLDGEYVIEDVLPPFFPFGAIFVSLLWAQFCPSG
jgi:hypothetical protein